MRNSFREIATYMDSVDTPLTMLELFDMHVGDTTNSFEEIVRRHSNSQRLEKKFLSQNTYCMDANIVAKKPYAQIRAGLWGQHIKDNYDISLLQEIFEDYIRDKLLSAWRENDGPLHFVDDTASRTPQSSGLMTISNDEITGKTFHEFNSETKVFGVDLEADKGILLTKYVLDTNHGIELYNTHFDSLQSKIRRNQINEVLTFINNNHQNTNLAILCGDFNIQSTSPNYEVLRQGLLSMGFIDVWEARNRTTGGTNLSSDDSQIYANIMCQRDPTNSRFCIDEDIDESQGDRRIDYLFIKSTNTNCPYIMDFTRPRRLILRNNLGSTTFEYMSDHLGIHTELLINRID